MPGARRLKAGVSEGVGSDELPAAGRLNPEPPPGLGAGQEGAQPLRNAGPSVGSPVQFAEGLGLPPT